MPSEPDRIVLRRYWDARDKNDAEAAAQEWETLTLNNFDRIKQIVKAFRFTAGGKGLPEPEWGSAASDAYMRAISMGTNFRERTEGQYIAALVTCVENACRDYGRKELRHQKRAAGSLDEKWDDTGEAGPYDAALARYDDYLREQATDAVETEASRRNAEQLVAWGISQIKNENYREVLDLTNQKVSADEIVKRLNISMDNLYARRSRGLKELEKILRDNRS